MPSIPLSEVANHRGGANMFAPIFHHIQSSASGVLTFIITHNTRTPDSPDKPPAPTK